MGLIHNVSKLMNISRSIAEDNSSDAYSTSTPFSYIFAMYGISIPIAVFLGYVGNIVTAIVLWSKGMASTTNLLLRALVVSDIVLITTAVLLVPGLILQDLEGNAVWHQGLATSKFAMLTSQMFNVYIIVFVSAERYLAICHPFKYSCLHSRRNVLVSIFVNALCSVLYNIPHFFATEVDKTLCDGMNSTKYCLWTDFGESSFYVEVYSVWMYTFFYFAVPLSILLTFNILIIKELKRMQIHRKRMGVETDGRMSEKVNVTKTIVVIVVVFTVVQTLGFISHLEYLITRGSKIGLVINFLYVVNSSINFVIYVAVGKKFRQIFVSVFFKCRC